MKSAKITNVVSRAPSCTFCYTSQICLLENTKAICGLEKGHLLRQRDLLEMRIVLLERELIFNDAPGSDTVIGAESLAASSTPNGARDAINNDEKR